MSTTRDASDDDRQEKRTAAPEQTKISQETSFSEPQASSTVIECELLESGYATKANEATDSVLEKSVVVTVENWNGKEIFDLEGTVIANPNAKDKLAVMEKRKPKLTEKGKAYQFSQNIRERKNHKREIQTRIANFGTPMGMDKNLELVGEESMKLNTQFKWFSEIHEDVQEILSEEERTQDCQIYDKLHQEIVHFREVVQKWMLDTDRRNGENQMERNSFRLSVKTKGSKSSRVSTASSKVKALEAFQSHSLRKGSLAVQEWLM